MVKPKAESGSFIIQLSSSGLPGPISNFGIWLLQVPPFSGTLEIRDKKRFPQRYLVAVLSPVVGIQGKIENVQAGFTWL